MREPLWADIEALEEERDALIVQCEAAKAALREVREYLLTQI